MGKRSRVYEAVVDSRSLDCCTGSTVVVLVKRCRYSFTLNRGLFLESNLLLLLPLIRFDLVELPDSVAISTTFTVPLCRGSRARSPSLPSKTSLLLSTPLLSCSFDVDVRVVLDDGCLDVFSTASNIFSLCRSRLRGFM